jgi:hypothetical protein
MFSCPCIRSNRLECPLWAQPPAAHETRAQLNAIATRRKDSRSSSLRGCQPSAAQSRCPLYLRKQQLNSDFGVATKGSMADITGSECWRTIPMRRRGPLIIRALIELKLFGAAPLHYASLALNAVPGLNPRIDPTQKWSDFFKSCAFEVLSSGGG